MKVLKTVGISFISLIVVLLIISFFLPSKIRVERSIEINSTPDVPFTLVNYPQNWQIWNPWLQMDPDMDLEFFGPEKGSGSGYQWNGNEKVKSGRLTIRESRPFEFITTEMDFGPDGKAKGYFRFESEGKATRVIWGMDADMGSNPVGKIFGLFMDGMVGRNYERGLSNLKHYIENNPSNLNGRESV